MATNPSFERQLALAWPPEAWQEMTVVVAVSGGADSVALLRGLARLKTAGAGRLLAAHFNHRWRAAESDADQQFVVDLCRQLELPCETGVATGAAPQRQGDGLEAAAREARYAFLLEAAQKQGARYVITAHTADDQAETILWRLLRGTGIAGLAGMRRARPLNGAVTLLRPMLQTRRAEVERYLLEIGQPWRDDASNFDTRFTRNKIRHELLPLLEREYHPGAIEAILRLGGLAADAARIVDAQAGELVEKVMRRHGPDTITIDCHQLLGVDPALVRELMVKLWREQSWPLQAMGHAEWNSLAEMIIELSNAKRMLPGPVEAIREEGKLTLVRPPGATGSASAGTV